MQSNIATGVAGQGLAALGCIRYLDKSVQQELLGFAIKTILSNQHPDGSWLFPDPTHNGKVNPYLNFSNGAAGVVHFLLQYYQYFEREEIRDSIVKALNWLESKANLKNGIKWKEGANKTANPWFNIGHAGIVKAFISAYEVFGEERHRALAENALLIYPDELTTFHLSVLEGIAGIGHLYLDAYRAFANPKWLHRGRWLAEHLNHTTFQPEKGMVYWLVDNDSLPYADFLSGSSGVMHFLARYSFPEKINAPLSTTLIK